MSDVSDIQFFKIRFITFSDKDDFLELNALSIANDLQRTTNRGNLCSIVIAAFIFFHFLHGLTLLSKFVMRGFWRHSNNLDNVFQFPNDVISHFTFKTVSQPFYANSFKFFVSCLESITYFSDKLDSEKILYKNQD